MYKQGPKYVDRRGVLHEMWADEYGSESSPLPDCQPNWRPSCHCGWRGEDCRFPLTPDGHNAAIDAGTSRHLSEVADDDLCVGLRNWADEVARLIRVTADRVDAGWTDRAADNLDELAEEVAEKAKEVRKMERWEWQ